MKITKKKSVFAHDEAKGKNILIQTLPGDVIEIIGADEYHHGDIGQILLRTDSEKEPLIGLADGKLWGISIDRYIFKRIDNYQFTV